MSWLTINEYAVNIFNQVKKNINSLTPELIMKSLELQGCKVTIISNQLIKSENGIWYYVVFVENQEDSITSIFHKDYPEHVKFNNLVVVDYVGYLCIKYASY